MKQQKRKKLVIQFMKYMVGGGLYFWSGYAVFAILYSGFGWDWLWAKMMADLIGWTLNFVVQRYWAFNHPELAGKTAKVSSRYAVITVFNFALDYLIVYSLKSIGVTPYLGMITSSLFFTAWNYLWYRFWVFSPKQTIKKSKRK